MKNIGNQLRELRMRRGYSQDQLAEMSNLNRVTIAKYEAGKIEPGAQALSRLADAFEISTDELLGRSLPERISIENLDESLIDLLTGLSPSEVQRVQDFVAGMRASKAR